MIKKKFQTYLENISILFLSLTILPFLILSIYVNPCWDDYFSAYIVNENGFLKSQHFWYVYWHGKFFANAALSSINPLIYDSMTGYKILPILLILGFIISSYFLIKEITSKSISNKEVLIFALVFCSLYFFKMPNVALGFYWMTSSVTYQLANILMMILFTFILRFFKEENSKEKSIQRILIIVLIFAVIGLNETSMSILVALLFLILTVNFLINKKINRQLFLFVFASALAAGIVYFAPGNMIREVNYPERHQLINSAIKSSTILIHYIFYRVFDTPILLLTILFIPVSIKIISSKKSELSFLSVNPVYSIALFLIILFAGFFTSFWAVGEGPYDRTVNVVYFIFLIGWFLNVLIIVNYIKVKFGLRYHSLPKYALIIICVVIAFSFRKENNIRIAYKELLYGTAYTFDEELKNRYRKIYEDKSDTCLVESIKSPVPYLFFFYDVGMDPELWANKAQATYFNKKFFIVKKDSAASIK
ncbi:MAG: DUF6056 family protein [Bacteroidota bacterium]|nr:DUF6056 family protein [Bacteroidota bacterium]